ncbi:hypothetical protein GDO78_016394, partial [Eleutherodactylus coqui]
DRRSLVWSEEHSCRVKVCENHLPNEEEVGGGTLPEGAERAVPYRTSPGSNGSGERRGPCGAGDHALQQHKQSLLSRHVLDTM